MHSPPRYTVGLVPGDLLDLILIVLVIAFGVAGYRQGFIIGVLSFAGFIGGGAIGAAFGPRIARAITTNPGWQAVTAIIVVFLAAMIGQLLASGLGVAMRSRLTWRPATVVDAVGGAVVSVLSVLLIAWLIGSAVAYAPFPAISRQVNDSAILRTVDRLMPAEASVMFSDFRSLLESGPYAQVFGALGAESALAVGPPNPAVLDSPALRHAAPSIVKVEGIAPSCSEQIEGSGFVYAPHYVLTNAHVVAGVTEGSGGTPGPDVYTTQGTFPARVVLYDPKTDLAVLYVPFWNAPALSFAGQAKVGGNAIVAGYPRNGGFTPVPARIGGIEQATSPDIYQADTVTRQIYSIRASVEPGNSGGPLLNPLNGRVYGVVFAAATSVTDTGYALTAAQVHADAQAGIGRTSTVSTQGCD
jgi:S1-C subfamily serine protease